MEHVEFEGPLPPAHHLPRSSFLHGIERGGSGFLHGIERRLDRLSVMQGVLLAATGVLALDWLVAPKGRSVIGQAIDKIAPGHHLGHPHPLALPPAPATRGYYAGANLGAGFGHGYMPYGPWAHADPGGPTQYPHAALHRNPAFNATAPGWYDWE